MNVDLYEDRKGRFHYFAYTPGLPGARKAAAALCGLSRDGMREAAWFRPGDRRGQVHYDRACVDCRAGLAV